MYKGMCCSRQPSTKWWNCNFKADFCCCRVPFVSKGELGSLCSKWAQAVVCSAFTLCSLGNGGHLNIIPAPHKQCLFSLGDHCATLAEWRNPQVTHLCPWLLRENSWLRLLNTLLKPSQESLELTEMEYAPLFGKGLLSKVSSGSMRKKLKLGDFRHLKF